MPKQAIVQPSIEAIEIIDTPIPIPKDKEVVINVVVSGTNPKDWKLPLWKGFAHNSGDDIAGIVHSIGPNVIEYKPGDRVGAVHEFGKVNGSFAEYAVALEHTTFHIPPNISFEEAATVPSSALTAALALYVDLKVRAPYISKGPSEAKTPILIYGVTSACGAFAAKLARLSGLKPIIGIAGRASAFAETLVDYVIDYRNGEDALVTSIEEILAREGLGIKVPKVFDAISQSGSLEATLRFIDPDGGIVSTLLPPKLFAKDKEKFKYPDGVVAINTAAPQLFSTHKDFAYVWARYLGRLLGDGRLTSHPFEVIPGGLNGVLTGLQNLKEGKASAIKYVYRIEETGDVGLVTTAGAHKARTTVSGSDEVSRALKEFPFSL